jgi:hypothetical protein
MNGLTDFNLFLLIILPQIAFSLILAGISILICLILEVYLHFKQYKKGKNGSSFWETDNISKRLTKNKNNLKNNGNIWDLNHTRSK